jgi:flavin-dependent dehydrogenase
MNQDTVDALIVGGGPAGSATALALARLGRSSVVIERSNYGGTRIGETLPPIAKPALIELGVWDRFAGDRHAPAFGTRSFWGKDRFGENDFIFSPYGNGWHIDRARFDSMLASSVEQAGMKVCREAQAGSWKREPDGWEVEIVQNHVIHRCHARFLVDASGRASLFARRQGARRITLDQLIGAVVFVPQHSAIDSFTMVEAVEDGWWYSVQLPNLDLVAAYMTDADLYARDARSQPHQWQSHLQRTQHTRASVGTVDAKDSPVIIPAGTSRLDPVSGPNWLAVGDAAMTVDPLSSQGICHALGFGRRAAEAIDAHLSGDRSALGTYARTVAEAFNNYLEARGRFYDRERRWPHSTFWQRRWSMPQGQLSAFAARA